MMEFGPDGTVVRFVDPLIHTLCKTGGALRGSEEFHTIENRKSVILIGDQPGKCSSQ